jgi:MFS family permease
MPNHTAYRIEPQRVIFPLGLGTALSLMGDATLYTVLPTHTSEAGIALGSVGLILSINRIIRILINSPTGRIYDRVPRRWLFVPSLFIGAISTALYAYDGGLIPLLAGRLLWGIAWAGIWVGGATIILDVSDDQQRGQWTGVYQVWFFLGTGLGAAIGGFLTDWLGYRQTMGIAALVTTLGGLIALFSLPETRTPRSDPVNRIKINNPWKWYHNRSLYLAMILQAMNRMLFAGVLASTMALLVKEYLQPSDILLGVGTVTGLLMLGRTLFNILAAPLSGVISDRLGNRWSATLGSAILAVASMVLIAMGNSLALVIGILVGATASGGLQTLTTALLGDQIPIELRGRAVGLLHTSSDVGGAIGPLFAYPLILSIGYGFLYLFCASLMGLVTVLFFFSRNAFTKNTIASGGN